jgi:hypothetical protein
MPSSEAGQEVDQAVDIVACDQDLDSSLRIVIADDRTDAHIPTR